MSTQNFVSTEWLAAHLNDADVAIVDASWYLPTMNRDGKREYAEGHIPNAVHFDIDAIADTSSTLPHMLPSADQFARSVGAMGISDKDHIVVYDGAGLFAAARVWWTFRVMGAARVSILQGGSPKWKSENRPWTAEKQNRPAKFFVPNFKANAVASLNTVKDVLYTKAAQIVDARPADRFRGEASEPRPGLKSGHMPGSFNVPFAQLVQNGALIDKAGLKQAFESSGLNLDKPMITSCGSGVSAAILVLALEELGTPAKALYDGSWAEWGGRDDTDIVKG